MCNTFSFCVVCMYVPMSVTLGPWGLPSDVIHKRRARVAWLHGLCPRTCHMVTWFARVTWLHGLRVSHGYMVCLALARRPSPSPTACGWIRELQRCSVSSYIYNYNYRERESKRLRLNKKEGKREKVKDLKERKKKEKVKDLKERKRKRK